jgi:hypothetical protein
MELVRQRKQAALKRYVLLNEGVMGQIESVAATLRLKLETVAAMKGDIESNLDKIITKIDTAPFNQIILNYENNLTNLEAQVSDQISFQRVDVNLRPKQELERKIAAALDEVIAYKKETTTLFGREGEQKHWKPKDYLEQVPETNSLSHDEDLTHSTRSLGPLQSLQGISRTTNLREEPPEEKNFAFNYQFYKRMSTEVDRVKGPSVVEADPNQAKHQEAS